MHKLRIYVHNSNLTALCIVQCVNRSYVHISGSIIDHTYSSRRKSKSASSLLRSAPSFIYENVATPSGSVAPVGDSKFNMYLVQTLHNPGLVHLPPPKDSRGYSAGRPVASQYHERAKRGYVYWPVEKKRLPAQLLKTIGSGGTNLGIGSAPRT